MVVPQTWAQGTNALQELVCHAHMPQLLCVAPQLAQRKARAPRFAAAALADEPTITPLSEGQVEVTQRLNADELAALGSLSSTEELPPKAQNWPWLTAP